jgi:hypothetical protein
LRASSAQLESGAPITLTATVSGASPSGTVTFFDRGITLGSAALSGRAASLVTPALAPGRHEFTARYRGDGDDLASASGSPVVVQANAPRRPPTANAGRDQSPFAATTVQLTGTGTDPDGGPLTFAWRQLEGPALSLVGASTATLSFTTPRPLARFTFQLTVTDETGLSASDQVVVATIAREVVDPCPRGRSCVPR